MALAGSYTAMLRKLVTSPSHPKRHALIYLGITLGAAVAITLSLSLTLGFGVSVSYNKRYNN